MKEYDLLAFSLLIFVYGGGCAIRPLPRDGVCRVGEAKMQDYPEGGELYPANDVRRCCKKNSVLSCMGKRTREGCKRGSGTIPSVSSKELALPHLVRCELSRLRCHGHSLLLSSYLCKIKRKANSTCSICEHPLQDLTHFWVVLHLSLSGAPYLALLLPFLTSGPDLGAWPTC